MSYYGELPHRPIQYADIPFYHRTGYRKGLNSLIWCGAVKLGGNEPYCYTEEKQCAGRVCRVLTAHEHSDNSMVVRDDGTVWKISFDAFKEVFRLDVVDKED